MAGRTKGSKNTRLHIWSEEEKSYLAEVTPGRHYREILELLNKKFEYQFSLGQIKGAIARYNLNTGFNGQFKNGSVPFNKGKKGICAPGSEKGWFKKGNTPVNHKPVGSERVDVDGYTLIKIAEPGKWVLKHKLIWEEHNGKIPKNHVVIFGDGNKNNMDITNLILVSRQQLLIMNRNNLIKNDIELTKVGALIANLHQKINFKKYKIKKGVKHN